MLVADAEGGRGQRNLLVHARRGPLPEERDVRAADQRGTDEVRRRVLDLGDRRGEVGHVEREEIGLLHGALALLDVVRDPLGGDLAVIVVGGEHVGLVAPLLHRIVDDRLDRLCRRRAGDEAVAVAHAAFVEDVVEVERVGAAVCLPHGFARGRGDAGVGDIDLVLADELLRVFRVKRDVRLAVVLLELELAAEQAAGGVDLVDRQRVRHHDRLAVDVENAGIVLDAPDLDRAVGGLRVQEREARRQGRCTCGIQQCPAGYGHDVSLVCVAVRYKGDFVTSCRDRDRCRACAPRPRSSAS